MKIKIYFAAVSVLFFVLAFLSLNGSLLREDLYSQTGRDEMDKLEDSIIINNIKMESDEPMQDESLDFQNGRIIYDHSFDEPDSVDDKSIDSIHGGSKSVNKKQVIERLRKKNSCWHLTSHKIKRGENLWSIAKHYGVNHKLIIRVNKINNPDMLKEGKTIYVPNKLGMMYRIKSGDTLNKVVKRYRINRKKFVEINNIKKGILIANKMVFLPDAVRPAEKEKKSSIKHESNIKRKEPAREYACLNNNSSGSAFAWPLRGKITSAFGNRIDPFSKKRRFHCGLDISAEPGTLVKASMAGKVIFSGWKDGYGNVVIIKHKKGYITVYAHNRKNLVKEDGLVKAGELIAYSGMTGAATGGHLHFEIRKYVTPLNPLRFLNR